MSNERHEEKHLKLMTVASHSKALAPSMNLEDVLDAIDELHTQASEGQEASFTGLSKREIICLLRELIFTAEETIYEIENGQIQEQTPILRVVERPEVLQEDMQENKHEKIG